MIEPDNWFGVGIYSSAASSSELRSSHHLTRLQSEFSEADNCVQSTHPDTDYKVMLLNNVVVGRTKMKYRKAVGITATTR